MENPPDFDMLLRRAGAAFREATGGDAVFSAPVVMKEGLRSRTLRCRVEPGGAGVSSIIVKQNTAEPAKGFSDWAGVAFLSALPGARGIAPRFHGGDAAARFFLIEDLGDGTNLQELLGDGGGSAVARTALLALAVQMARLHAATLVTTPLTAPDIASKHEESYDAIRAGLPHGVPEADGTDGLGRAWEARLWLGNRGKIAAWFHALGCEPPAGFEQCLETIAGVYAAPGEFLAFTHGDPAPTNNHFAKNGAPASTLPHLVDFEYGAFRHALYDITGWAILCPLPQDCLDGMRRAFHDELAKACPAARDEARFAREWATLCAWRALAMLTWIPPDILATNRIWAESWTMREAALVAMSRLEQTAAPYEELAPASKAAGALAQAMRKHWPEYGDAEAVLPQWPALKAR